MSSDEGTPAPEVVMTFSAVQALVRMLEVAPGFREEWEDVEWLANPPWPIRTESIFTVFDRYIVPRIERGEMEGIPQVFAFIEEAMHSPRDDWRNGAGAHFLEMISNCVPSTISPEAVIPLMGPLSRKSCRAWAEWSGADASDLALWDGDQ